MLVVNDYLRNIWYTCSNILNNDVYLITYCFVICPKKNCFGNMQSNFVGLLI